MSALLDNLPRYRQMTEHDLDAVIAIENAIYPHPWTRGNFSDSLRAGYQCRIMEAGGALVGYAVVMIAAGEAHLLNLSIAAQRQRGGFGRALLQYVLAIGRDFHAGKIFLEVRPTNEAARGLYADAGFSEIALRRGYYPAPAGREDAIVLELKLQ